MKIGFFQIQNINLYQKDDDKMKFIIDENVKSELRSNLTVFRAVGKISQKDLCEFLETSITTLSQVENGEKHFSEAQYFVLLRGLMDWIEADSKLRGWVEYSAPEIKKYIDNTFIRNVGEELKTSKHVKIISKKPLEAQETVQQAVESVSNDVENHEFSHEKVEINA